MLITALTTTNNVRRQWIMLILTRRLNETLVIGDNITVTVVGIAGSRVRIGVNAPRDVSVKREKTVPKARTDDRLPHSGP
jgi:carbon storage regulator